MKRPIALLVGGLVAASLTITPVGPASAATVTVPIPGGNATVTLTFPDIQWNDFKACQDGAPLVEVTGGSWVQEWDFGASIFPPGEPRSTPWATRGGWGEGTGTFSKDQTWLSLCPEKDAKSGVHTVRGTVSVSVDPSDIGVWFDEPFQTTFTVSPMVSTTITCRADRVRLADLVLRTRPGVDRPPRA